MKKVKGLSSQDAKSLLLKFGPNKLPEKPPPSSIKILIAQFKSPLVYILLVAAVVTFFLGQYADTVIITLAVLLNTILGFIQEKRAGQALFALKKLIHNEATVIRDGKQVEVLAEEVTLGDICILNQGDKIPADGKLVFANRTFIDEAILTGESLPVAKEENEDVFMGTIVSSGRAMMQVVSTGENTKIGSIAASVQQPEEDTPLRRQLAYFSRQLTYLVIVLIVIVIVIGLISGLDLVDIFTTSVALAVASIPEGLLVGLTVVLAVGMQRILRRKGLVRHLISAETLGGVTIICTDKTGTLTEGKMRVVDTLGSDKNLSMQAFIANDLDDPIVIAAYDWAKSFKISEAKMKKYKRLDSLPFSSKDRFFASLNKWGDENMLFVNGAPDYLLEWTDLSKAEKKRISEKIEEYTREGKRLMGLAKKRIPKSKRKLASKDVKEGLTWVGILVFNDPVRPSVKSALRKTASAGIDTLVITGDYPQTAVAVMGKLGLGVGEDEIILGHELEKIKIRELKRRLKDKTVKLFARTTPDQKMKIVTALKENGEVIAMMGDGVNDAPAIRRSDIGVVVGEASDVAKESADLVLLDSSFDTVVSAIEEGRGIFDNIRKIILYLMSDAFGEIVAVIGILLISLFMGVPISLPVTAVQILWINLVSDGFPHLALTVDPKRDDIMDTKPRDPNERLVSSWMKELIFVVSIVGGIVAIVLYLYALFATKDVVYARSIAFATLGVNSLVYVFSVRTLTKPFWSENPLNNKWLNVAVFAGLALQILPFMFGAMRQFLGITILSVADWVMVFTAAIVVFVTIEIMKVFVRHSR